MFLQHFVLALLAAAGEGSSVFAVLLLLVFLILFVRRGAVVGMRAFAMATHRAVAVMIALAGGASYTVSGD